MGKLKGERVYDNSRPEIKGTVIEKGEQQCVVRWDDNSAWGKESITLTEHLTFLTEEDAEQPKPEVATELAKTNKEADEIVAIAVAKRKAREATRNKDGHLPDAPKPVKSTKSTKSKGSKPPMKKVAKKVAAAPKTKKVAAAAPKKRAKKANGETSKTKIIADLLTRKSGCTRQEIKDATGWPTVSVQAMAKANGLKLRQDKKPGSVTRYFAS